MSTDALIKKIIANYSNVMQENLLTGNLSDNVKNIIIQKTEELKKNNIIIDQSKSLTIYELEDKATKLKEEQPTLGLIVIDYLGLISSGKNQYNKNYRYLEIQEYTRRIHELARKLNVAIVLLCQLNRKTEERGDRPLLSDLRESGSIEQDADLVLLLHSRNSKEFLRQSNTNLIIAKNRNGRTGEIKFTFKKEYCQFEEQKEEFEKKI